MSGPNMSQAPGVYPFQDMSGANASAPAFPQTGPTGPFSEPPQTNPQPVAMQPGPGGPFAEPVPVYGAPSQSMNSATPGGNAASGQGLGAYPLPVSVLQNYLSYLLNHQGAGGLGGVIGSGPTF